jgi:hypothetical protein
MVGARIEKKTEQSRCSIFNRIIGTFTFLLVSHECATPDIDCLLLLGQQQMSFKSVDGFFFQGLPNMTKGSK